MKLSLAYKLKIAAVLASATLISACSDDTEIVEVERIVEVEVEVPAPVPDPIPFSYTVTVTNLTHAQPLSPMAVVLHEDGYLWQIGEVASVDIEVMAEGGANDRLIALPQALTSASGGAPIGPGGSDTLTVTVNDIADARLTVATMLVNTNDAFAGLNAYNLGGLEVGDSFTTTLGVYDAGTEANTEAAGTMPGPVDGGEGFNAMRDDVGFVARHPGVVTSDDGLSTSVLTGLYKFDNPAMRVTVMRTE